MAYRAKDGRVLPSVVQGRKYEQSLAERGKDMADNAPGGPAHLHDIREHGLVQETHIVQEGNGRWRLTNKHADGTESTSVHPERNRAHELAGRYLNPEDKPPALDTHRRSRNTPVGEKEDKRVAKEDGRDDGYARAEDFEDGGR